MPSTFHTLNTGYSGLLASQAAIDTTGHNISNAETEGYSRQRVMDKTALPLEVDIYPGDLGTGTQVSEIARVHDEFVFQRYIQSSSDQEHALVKQDYLSAIDAYFPEIDGVGIKNDLYNYYDAWSAVSQDPSSVPAKTELAQRADALAQNIGDLKTAIDRKSAAANDQIVVTIDEINRIAAQIAELNQNIFESESIGVNHANDYRDQRDKLEKELSDLVDIEVFKKNIISRHDIDRRSNDWDENYVLNIGGYNIINNKEFHKLIAKNDDNQTGSYKLFYERQDLYHIPIEKSLKGGKIGALLDLRGRDLDENGRPVDGIITEISNNLNGFANGLIVATNKVYSTSAASYLRTPPLDILDNLTVKENDMNIKPGTFDLVVYNTQGDEVARRTVEIGEDDYIQDVVDKMTAIKDDNNDNDTTNDFDDYYEVFYQEGQLQVLPKEELNGGFKVGVTNDETNISGAFGLRQFFSGEDANDIKLNEMYKIDPAQISAHKKPTSGNNEVANDMLQMQYDRWNFFSNGVEKEMKMPDFFDFLATDVASKAKTANDAVAVAKTRFNIIKAEQDNVAKVNIDEELTNLIKFQTGYSANARVITTIDQMIDTLLGLKR